MWFWIPRTSQHFLKFACCPDSSKVGQHSLYQAGMAELLTGHEEGKEEEFKKDKVDCHQHIRTRFSEEGQVLA